MINVLAIIPAGDDQSCLREIARTEKWNFAACADIAEARRALRTGPRFSVVILRGNEWREDLPEVQALAPWAAVIVSGTAIWKDVVELGGYDVLPSPFSPPHVARVVLHASWFAASRVLTR